MKLIKMEKVKDGRYLKNYELVYQNKAGKEKNMKLSAGESFLGWKTSERKRAACPLRR